MDESQNQNQPNQNKESSPPTVNSGGNQSPAPPQHGGIGSDNDRNPHNQPKKLKEISIDRKIELGLTAALVIFGAFQIIAALVINHGTSKQVDKIITAANGIKGAADSFSASADKINSGVQNAASQLSVQAEAATTQAQTSKSLAGITAKEFSFNEQIAESQRATIGIEFYRVLNPVTFHEKGLSEAFSVLLVNNGQIRASDILMRFKVSYIQWGQDEFTEPPKRQAALCDKPPTAQERMLAKSSQEGDVIFPGGHEELQINFGMDAPAPNEIIKWPPDSAYAQNPNLKVAQTNRVHPIVVGCVDYRSGAIPGDHQAGFIFDIERTGENPELPTFITIGDDVPRQNVIVTKYYFSQGKNY